MTPALYGYGVLALVAAVCAILIGSLMGRKHAVQTAKVTGQAEQAQTDRAQAIVDAAQAGPEALEAEARKVFADLDAELGKKP